MNLINIIMSLFTANIIITIQELMNDQGFISTDKSGKMIVQRR